MIVFHFQLLDFIQGLSACHYSLSTMLNTMQRTSFDHFQQLNSLSHQVENVNWLQAKLQCSHAVLPQLVEPAAGQARSCPLSAYQFRLAESQYAWSNPRNKAVLRFCFSFQFAFAKLATIICIRFVFRNSHIMKLTKSTKLPSARHLRLRKHKTQNSGRCRI